MIVEIIAKYLSSNKRLVVPNLGTFIVKVPAQTILFSNLIKNDDGCLRGLLKSEGMSELDAAALLLGEGVDNVAHDGELVVGNGLLGGVGVVVGRVGGGVFKRDVAVALSFDTVEREVAADGEAEGFDVVDVVPVVAFVPNLDERILHDILGFGTVERDAQREAVKLILQR